MGTAQSITRVMLPNLKENITSNGFGIYEDLSQFVELCIACQYMLKSDCLKDEIHPTCSLVVHYRWMHCGHSG